MNRTVLCWVFLLFTFFSNCGETNTPEEKVISLELNVDKLELDQKASESNFVVFSNTGWTVTSSQTWLKTMPVKSDGDRKVTLSTGANNDVAHRTAIVTVSTDNGDHTKTLTVTQAGTGSFISFKNGNESASASHLGEDISVAINASGPWTVQIPDQAKTWITIKMKTDTEAVLSVAPNGSAAARETVIVFKLDDDDKQVTFNLSQLPQPGTLNIAPRSANVTDEAGEVTVTVTSNKTWNVVIPPADTWVKVKQQTDTQVDFSFDENPAEATRTSNIVFKHEDNSNECTFVLTQAGKETEYTLMGTLEPAATYVGWNYSQLHNNWLRNIGFDYSEHPHCTGIGGHIDGTHLVVEKDDYLDKYVLRFDIHITPVIDSDRCGTYDRQRNELKSATNNTTWAKMQGNWDEWQRLEWKFKIPVGFQPTNSFCHIHQLKAQDGSYNGSPLITITPRANSNGTNKRMQIIHTSEGGKGSTLGTVVDNIPLSDFEGEWVQVEEIVHYMHNGYFSIKITRIRDGKVLLSYERNNIDMWRPGSSYIRNKFGIYRSLAGGNLQTGVPPSSLLKNESIWMCDFKIYEKNSNPNPTQTH